MSHNSAPATATRAAFDADGDRFERLFRASGALRTDRDGFRWVDESRVPAAVVSAYRRWLEHGYANGLLP